MAKLRRTVFVTDPSGARVRLTKGTDAPRWYKGSATSSAGTDRLVANFHPADSARHPVAQGPVPGDGHVQPADAAKAAATKAAPAPVAEAPVVAPEPTAAVEPVEPAAGADAEASGAEPGGQEAQQEASEAGNGDQEPELAMPTDAELIDGSVSDVLDRVGDNLVLAERALEVEQTQEKPRATLIASLGSLVKALTAEQAEA